MIPLDAFSADYKTARARFRAMVAARGWPAEAHSIQASGFGQESAPPQTMKGVVRKNLVPISKDVLIVKFPRPVERKLKNGLELLVLENHRVPTVSFSLVIPSSSLSEPNSRLQSKPLT